MLPLVPEEAQAPIQNALDQIQMLYVRETSDKEEEPPPPEPKSKIWTPGS
jgi:hypothetical protein